jgi:ribonuclease MRP protein subunit SNM1
MATPELSARLKFLNESAHLLAITAPAVSRHVMSTYNSLLSESNLDPAESHKRGTCGACGTIMILGLEATMEQQRGLKRHGKRRRNVPQSKFIIYQCKCCNKKSQHPIPTSLPRHQPRVTAASKRTSKTVPLLSTKSQLSSNPVAPESSNSSSKKRAKTRKQGGLQALLAKQKASQGTSSGFGLDLLDFMKK